MFYTTIMSSATSAAATTVTSTIHRITNGYIQQQLQLPRISCCYYSTCKFGNRFRTHNTVTRLSGSSNATNDTSTGLDIGTCHINRSRSNNNNSNKNIRTMTATTATTAATVGMTITATTTACTRSNRNSRTFPTLIHVNNNNSYYDYVKNDLSFYSVHEPPSMILSRIPQLFQSSVHQKQKPRQSLFPQYVHQGIRRYTNNTTNAYLYNCTKRSVTPAIKSKSNQPTDATFIQQHYPSKPSTPKLFRLYQNSGELHTSIQKTNATTSLLSSAVLLLLSSSSLLIPTIDGANANNTTERTDIYDRSFDTISRHGDYFTTTTLFGTSSRDDYYWNYDTLYNHYIDATMILQLHFNTMKTTLLSFLSPILLLPLSSTSQPNIMAYSTVIEQPTFIGIQQLPEEMRSDSTHILEKKQHNDKKEKPRTMFQRVYGWLQQFMYNCYDILFIFSRTMEVLIRFLPLVLLTPASMLYEQYILSLPSSKSKESSTLSKSLVLDVEQQKHSNWVSDVTWMYVRYAITSLGPAFVKLGQWIATRRDIFPPNICDRLSVLHDKCTTNHPWIYTHQTLCNAFGSNYYELGLQINESSTVIGSGSAAQVYSGTLIINQEQKHKNSNNRTNTSEVAPVAIVRPVAVKVLHPNMSERVERDLYFVQAVANWLHTLPIERLRLLNLPRAVTNFGTILLRQADLQIEADHLHQFRSNFYHDNDTNEVNSSIVFPKPYNKWVSKQVLVEDLVSDAIPISEYLLDNSSDGTIKRKELASPLLRAFLKMIFIDNFVHCDLHAGNVLIQTYQVDPTTSTTPSKTVSSFISSIVGRIRSSLNNVMNVERAVDTTNISESIATKQKIVFLDAGIAMSLHPIDQRNLHDLFRAVLLNDGNRAGRLMVERAQYERCSHIPGGVDAFASGIEDLVSEFHIRRKDGLTLGTVQIGSLLSRVLDLCRIYGVEIDPNMSSIVISTLVLEGLRRSLDPELNLIDFALPFVLGRGRV